MRNPVVLLVFLCISGGSLSVAQSCRCDWSVVAAGGRSMVGGAYRCDATAGQTATGGISTSQFLALIGFWQTDYRTGIEDERPLPAPITLATRLEAIAPNPFCGRTVIRYTLAAEQPVTLRIHDLSGRIVRILCGSVLGRGAYRVSWDGRDDAGRRLAPGVYFCRFAAGDVRATGKLVVAY